jgi:hypothetical protein
MRPQAHIQAQAKDRVLQRHTTLRDEEPFFGGLQFTLPTWRANGGLGNPAHASRAQQITVAERVLRSQGIGAWPVCGKRIWS